jgi:hypothetical protein
MANVVWKVVINTAKSTLAPKFFKTEEEARAYINGRKSWPKNGRGYDITKITTV